MKSNAIKSLFSDNPRYKEMFEVDTQPSNAGIDLEIDYTDAMNALRDKAPVQQGSLRQLLGLPVRDAFTIEGRPNVTMFSYRACEIGFRENLIFSSKIYAETAGLQEVGTSILSMVGKPHKRLRSAAQPLFKRPKVLNWWNKRWIEETVDVLLERIQDQDAVDLNHELCARLPMATITRAVGLEGENVIEFRHQMERSTFGASRIPPEEAAEARDFVNKTLRDLVTENLRNPGDNLISGLLQSEITDDDGNKRKLTEDELFGYAKLAIFAGGGTTWRQLGITIDALMNHYDFWEACVNDRSLIDQAVEEGLRWRATDPVFQRVSVEDAEVEGFRIPAGTRIDLCLGAANHDPTIFRNPGEYDIFRDKSHHMGFGFGPHRCLGMDVARQEMIVAINGLMDRFPNMKLDPDKPKPTFRGLEHRGMSAVTVRLKG